MAYIFWFCLFRVHNRVISSSFQVRRRSPQNMSGAVQRPTRTGAVQYRGPQNRYSAVQRRWFGKEGWQYSTEVAAEG